MNGREAKGGIQIILWHAGLTVNYCLKAGVHICLTEHYEHRTAHQRRCNHNTSYRKASHSNEEGKGKKSEHTTNFLMLHSHGKQHKCLTMNKEETVIQFNYGGWGIFMSPGVYLFLHWYPHNISAKGSKEGSWEQLHLIFLPEHHTQYWNREVGRRRLACPFRRSSQEQLIH